MSIETRIPHSLRLPIFFLRVALGVNFFYVGWTSLFNHGLVDTLRARSLGWLYSWLAAPTPFAGVPSSVFAWILLIVGIVLIIGLFTRLASLIAIALIILSLLTAINFSAFNPTQLVNDEIIALFGLFVLIFSKAGTYLSIDKFIKWSRRHHE